MEKDVNPGTSDCTDGSKAKASPTPEQSRRVLRVWVVEDSPQLRECFAQFLTFQSRFKCNRQFASAETVLKALKEERPPDIILMDVNLKGRSGLSAIRPIKELAPDVKVVMMTTFTNSHYELEAYTAGASGFLLKSYDLNQIRDVLRDAYRRSGARDLFPNLVHHQVDAQSPHTEAAAPLSRPLKVLKNLQQIWTRRKTSNMPRLIP